MNKPGDGLRAFAARWCRPDTMARVIDPLIADLQLEHEEAAHAGRRWKARLVRTVAWFAFIKVVVLCVSRDAIPSREARATDDRRVLARVLAWSSAIMIVVIALLELPFISAYAPALHQLTPMRFVYLVPQGIGLALPIGATLGVVLGLGGREISTRVRVCCLALAALASAAAFVNLGWVTPAANQAFRSLESGRIDPGIGELPLGQLVREIERFNHDPAFRQFGYLLALSFAFHNRIALSFSPLVFVLFAFSMLSVSVMRRWMLVAASCVAFFSYYMFLLGGRSLVFDRTAAAYAVAWLPNVVLCLAAATMTVVTRRLSRGRRTAVSSAARAG
jgi:hypothetical protein